MKLLNLGTNIGAEFKVSFLPIRVVIVVPMYNFYIEIYVTDLRGFLIRTMDCKQNYVNAIVTIVCYILYCNVVRSRKS